MFSKEIKGINKAVQSLVSSCENEGIEVTNDQIILWFMEILGDLDKSDIVQVTSHLLKVEHTKENLLEVYSFVNDRFEEKMSLSK